MRGRSKLTTCHACRPGNLVGFNWPDAQRSSDRQISGVLQALALHRHLRVGFLYRCRECELLWHLNDAEKWMSVVPPDRERLIDEWDVAPITLSARHSEKLRQIGTNAPSFLGMGSESRDTPCSVTTITGETFDHAIISQQAEAPVHEWRSYRLATTLAEVRESPDALPLDVRLASGDAQEIAMGFAPTLIEMPDGEQFTLNGSSYFLVGSSDPSNGARLSMRQLSRSSKFPPITSEPDDLIYFVADPE